jgi:D-amino-acid oxidase
MDRRTLLKAGGLALASLGCGASAAWAARRILPALPPVDASWDRVVRTTVGLRPYRAGGFVVRAEKIDAKTIVHNYAHGGAGMSLAWGTAALAADLAVAHADRRAAVLGCGVEGLTTARQLQRRGFDVMIYAASLPPNTTSNMSLATFTPAAGLVDAARRNPEWDRQFRQAAEVSYGELQQLVGPRYGVRWYDNYHATDDLHARPTQAQRDESRLVALLPEYLRPDYNREVFGPREHPFPAKYAVRTSSLSIEPSTYLEALLGDVTGAGGRVTLRAFETIHDVMALDEPLVVNATGLGARSLFGDAALVPVKGQLTVLAPQPEVTYRVSARLKGGVIVGTHPRSDGIVLGHLQQKGNWSLEPEDEVRQWMVESAIAFFAAMKRPAVR